MTYALDTNTVVYFFRGQGRIAEKLLSVPPGEVALPAVVLYELEVGAARSAEPAKRLRQLAQLCDHLRILPFGGAEGRAAARVRAELERIGTPIRPMDTLIAGTALAAGAVLVTRNVSEFGRVRSLLVENWFVEAAG